MTINIANLANSPGMATAPPVSATPSSRQSETENQGKIENKASPAQSQPSRQSVEKAVNAANQAMANKPSNELRFSIDDDTGISVIKLLDQKTGETIQQIPSKQMLEIAKYLDQVTGSLIKQKA